MSPPPTGTHHPLPFGDLSPDQFEAMCLWLVEREGFDDATYFGARGKDGGRDIEAWEQGRRVIFQCKRTQDLEPSQAVAEIEKLRKLPADEQPEVIHFLLGCNPKASTIAKARKAWGDAQTCRFWGRDHLDEKARRHPEIVERFFQWTPQGYAIKISGVSNSTLVNATHVTIQQVQGSAASTEPEGYRCQAPHPGADFVHRGELDTMVERLTSSTGDATIASTLAITTALQGAGGFGKTTLAQALCHHEKVQQAFPGGVLWVVMGEGLDDAGRIRSILDSVRLWTSANPPAFESAAAAGTHLRDLLNGRRVLVVVDDVWQRSDARPFEGLGAGSALLITTRNRDTLPPGTLPLDVDEMEPSEAVQLLGAGLGGKPEDFEPLARQLGEWPLLLKLVNGQLRKLTARGVEVAGALERVGAKLRDRGLSAFDHRDADAREDAVRLTMAAGFESGVLDEGDQERYRALAIFPEDTDIPIEVLAPYWALDFDDAEDLAERLFDLSLLQRFDDGSKTLRLHDVFREYLIGEQRTHLVQLNQRLLDAQRPESGRWSDLPPSADYLWRSLAHHLIEAGQRDALEDSLLDLDYLQARVNRADFNELLADFGHLTNNPSLADVAGAVRLSAHILARHPSQLAGQLLGRMRNPGDRKLGRLLESAAKSPGLNPRSGTLIPPGGPLIAVLEGHSGNVLFLKSMEDGRIVSAATDRTLRIWNILSGTCEKVLNIDSSGITTLELLKGSRVISGHYDGALQIWDLSSGDCYLALHGHKGAINRLQIIDNEQVISASDDATIRVWDLHTGVCARTMLGHAGAVHDVLCFGTALASASKDKTVRIWDRSTGECQCVLEHDEEVFKAIEVGGSLICSASKDGILRVWDTTSYECLRVLPVREAEGRFQATVSTQRDLIVETDKGNLEIIDPVSGISRRTLEARTGFPLALNWLDEGTLAVGSWDNALRIWEPYSGKCKAKLASHTQEVLAVESHTDGRIVSASSDGTIRLWSPSLSDEVRGPIGEHSGGVLALERIEAGRLVSASKDASLGVWDIATGECQTKLLGHSGMVEAVTSLDAGRVISASTDGTLRVWDLSLGCCKSVLSAVRSGLPAPVFKALDHDLIVSAAFDGSIRTWDSSSGVCQKIIKPSGAPIICLEQLSCSTIVVGTLSNELQIWDLASGEFLRSLPGHTGIILGLGCLDDDQFLSWSLDGTLRVWDRSTGDCLMVLLGHNERVRTVDQIDQNLVVSGAYDGSLRVWNRSTGECLQESSAHTKAIWSVKSLGATQVISGSYDKTLRVWDFVQDKELARFELESPVLTIKVISPNLIAAGDASGQVHILNLVEPGRSNET